MKYSFKIVLFASFLAIFSCGKVSKDYFYLSFEDNKTEIIKGIKTEGSILKDNEDGSWTFYDNNKKSLSKGEFSNGLKKGIWRYEIDGKPDSIEWKIYKKEAFSINIPKNWKVEQVSKTDLLGSIYDEKNPFTNNSFFSIRKSKNDSIDLEEHTERIIKKLKETAKIESKERFLIKNKNDKFYFSSYYIIKDKEEVLLLLFTCQQNGAFIDFTYSSGAKDKTMKENAFFELIKGCFIDSKRVFNPIDNYKLKELD